MQAPEPTETLPNFELSAASPRPPPALGIVLLDEPPLVTSTGPTWVLRGSFRVLRDDDSTGETYLRRIVVALTSGASFVTEARHACPDAVLFSTDVYSTEDKVSGFFNVNLADLFELTNREETFHIIVSIGALTSEVLTSELEFPWIDHPRGEPVEELAEDEEEEMEAEDEMADIEDDDSWMVDDPSEEE